MKTPFSILELSPLQIKAISSLSSDQRVKSLNDLRRYYASLFHPDVVKGTDGKLSEINNAIDMLIANPSLFNSYIAQSNYASPVNTRLDTALKDQVGYWKGELQKGQDYYKTVVLKYEDALKEIGQLKSYIKRVEDAREKQGKTNWNLWLQIKGYQQNLISRNHKLTIPAGYISLTAFEQHKYINSAGSVFYFEERWLFRDTVKNRKRPLGLMCGFITIKEMRKLNDIGDNYDLWRRDAKTLLEIKPYFREGMIVVILDGSHFRFQDTQTWRYAGEIDLLRRRLLEVLKIRKGQLKWGKPV